MGKIIIYGTSSSAGKSFLTMGLCRILYKMGYKVAPFKSQNMSRYYAYTADKKIISTAQVLQALAAGKKADVRMNPILLVPSTDTGSHIYLQGQYKGLMEAKDYFKFKSNLGSKIATIFEDLYKENDYVIIEGAGSPAEINLLENDIVNTGMARIADSQAILVVDIDRGGAFAHLYGTYYILPKEDRARIRGFIINKFRGDKSLLRPAIEEIEELTSVPVLGIIPYGQYSLPDEDSLTDGRKSLSWEEIDMTQIEKNLDLLARNIEENVDMAKLMEIMTC